MRKLATVQRINNVQNLATSDNLDVVTIKGWKVVTKRDEFKKDDLCIYFEVDSLLPIRPEFEFLRKSCYVKNAAQEGFRLKTIKLRGQISQGLALPISLFNLPSTVCNLDEYLGITKYLPPTNSSNDVIGVFPSFIPKTDLERIQNLYDEFYHLIDDIEDVEFEETVKLDGSSMSIYFYNSHFGVCSKNYELKETETNTYWKVANTYNLKSELTNLNQNIAIQGELIGEGINKNREKIKGHDFYIYSIWDIDKQEYITPEQRYALCSQLNLKHVPVLNKKIKIFKQCPNIESFLNKAETLILPISTAKEGLVYKSFCSSFKVINNKYLLKHND